MSNIRPARRFERRRRGGRFDGPATRIDLIGRTPLRPPATYSPPNQPPGTGGDGRRRGGARPLLRLSIAAVVVVALFATLVVRLWALQVLNGKRLNTVAEQITTRSVLTPAPRGLICAREGCSTTGQVLAGDAAEEVVTLATTISSNGKSRVASAAVEARLAALIPGLTLGDIRTALNDPSYGPYQPVPVATNVSNQTVLYIDEHPSLFPGVSASLQFERNYPHSDLATQTVGYVGGISASELKADAKYGYDQNSIVGQSGLEQQYDRVLQGTPGSVQEEVDPSGGVVKTLKTTAASPGDDVVLNMDIGLEQTLQNALAAQIVSLRATSGVPANWGGAVVLNAKTGAVLAMASSPTYNNNDWVPAMSESTYSSLLNNPEDPLNNYATVGLQAPGSTFKLATATAALYDGLVTPGYYYYDRGSFTLPNGQVLDDAPGDAGGDFNMSSALTYSSDVFFYNLGELFYEQSSRYGSTPIQNTAAKFGFGRPTGIDLPNTATGQVDSLAERKLLHKVEPALYGPASWFLGDNVELAFGQGETLVTPLQLADAYATFANGGTRYAPEMAAGVVTSAGSLVKRYAPKVIDRIDLSSNEVDYQALLSGFQGAVQSPQGTAYSEFLGFNFNKWNLAGKTGTATVNNNTNAQPTGWFVGFGGPKNSSAQYVVAVEVDQAGYGANTSAPVARQVFNYLYKHPLPAVALPASGGGAHH